MGYLKNKPGSLEAISATAIGMPEARTPEQQRTHDKMMKDFLAKGGKIQKIPAGKKTDPNKLKKPVKEDTEHFGISGIETQRPEHIDEQESKGKEVAKAPGDAASKTGDVETLKQQIGVLRQKLENEKQKAVKPQPNKDTGEVPLTVGVAYKHLKDKKEKEESKEKKENKKIQAKNKADKQVQEEEVELDEAMPGGANSSSKKGPVWKAWKAAQRRRRRKLNNSALPRQLKDKKKETMVSKNGKTIVIDKSQEKDYLSKGWSLAEDDSNNGRTMTGKPKSKVDLKPKIEYSR